MGGSSSNFRQFSCNCCNQVLFEYDLDHFESEEHTKKFEDKNHEYFLLVLKFVNKNSENTFSRSLGTFSLYLESGTASDWFPNPADKKNYLRKLRNQISNKFTKPGMETLAKLSQNRRFRLENLNEQDISLREEQEKKELTERSTPCFRNFSERDFSNSSNFLKKENFGVKFDEDGTPIRKNGLNDYDSKRLESLEKNENFAKKIFESICIEKNFQKKNSNFSIKCKFEKSPIAFVKTANAGRRIDLNEPILDSRDSFTKIEEKKQQKKFFPFEKENIQNISVNMMSSLGSLGQSTKRLSRSNKKRSDLNSEISNEKVEFLSESPNLSEMFGDMFENSRYLVEVQERTRSSGSSFSFFGNYKNKIYENFVYDNLEVGQIDCDNLKVNEEDQTVIENLLGGIMENLNKISTHLSC